MAGRYLEKLQSINTRPTLHGIINISKTKQNFIHTSDHSLYGSQQVSDMFYIFSPKLRNRFFYRTTQYSAPYRRNHLLGLHQYSASDRFPSLGKWDKARSEDLYVVRGTTGRNHPVQIVVVGAISSDRSNLQPHGNYDPSYMPLEQIGKKAKLQFVLTCPEDDPDFSSDYVLALQRLRAIQEEVAKTPDRREHFIEGDNLKMNFYLFTKKVSIGVFVHRTRNAHDHLFCQTDDGE